MTHTEIWLFTGQYNGDHKKVKEVKLKRDKDRINYLYSQAYKSLHGKWSEKVKSYIQFTVRAA